MFSMVRNVFAYPFQLVVMLKNNQNTSNDEISYYYSTFLEEVTEQHQRNFVDKPFTTDTSRMHQT